MLLREIKDIFHKELDGYYPKEEVAHFFYMLLSHYLALERFLLALDPQMGITKSQEGPLFEALSQLKRYCPIQYIIGTAYFMDMDFTVNEKVLIPRPETAELVHWIIDTEGAKKHNIPTETDQPLTILDIGTGSGCIAVSLAKYLAKVKVYALDLSESVLDVARRNAEVNTVDVTFILCNILETGNIALAFDVIVSNPPYIREQEKSNISKNVKDYEPASALFVPNEQPLLFYAAIVRFALTHLNTGGRLYFEINQAFGKEMVGLLKAHHFKDIELRKDVFGNERMIKATLSKSRSNVNFSM